MKLYEIIKCVDDLTPISYERLKPYLNLVRAYVENEDIGSEAIFIAVNITNNSSSIIVSNSERWCVDVDQYLEGGVLGSEDYMNEVENLSFNSFTYHQLRNNI